MSRATLTLEDDPERPGSFKMELDFGIKFDDQSVAHQVVAGATESILKWASTYQKLEDTAPGVDVEPSVIIKTN